MLCPGPGRLLVCCDHCVVCLFIASLLMISYIYTYIYIYIYTHRERERDVYIYIYIYIYIHVLLYESPRVSLVRL